MRIIPDGAWAVVTIWQEARGEQYVGKVAVAEVIRNRMKKHNQTAAEVVLKPYQFSGWRTQDNNRLPSALIDDIDPIVKDCVDAWNKSIDTSIVAGATMYCNLDVVTPVWLGAVLEVVKIGRHTFFKE